MKQSILGFFGLLVLALPQAASAQNQNFWASDQYTAKFLCGFAPGGEARLGVVAGHYNTIINVLAVRNSTALAYRATALSSDFEIETGVPSEFSRRFDFDRDGGIGILCRDIKNLLLGGGSEGFIEGIVTIYGSKPLIVTDVLTSEDDAISAMQVYEVERRSSSQRVRPPILE